MQDEAEFLYVSHVLVKKNKQKEILFSNIFLFSRENSLL
jgi:hypothetical protein